MQTPLTPAIPVFSPPSAFAGLSVPPWLSWRTLRLPALLSLIWCVLLFTLYNWTVQREDEYADELARLQTGTLYSNILAVRAWNAAHGGVWVEDSERYPANPWIPEPERTLDAGRGRRLVRVNPAYMTRQIADYSTVSLASFRIAGLTPVRPGNRADLWETGALMAFQSGVAEAFALVSDESGDYYRYMAPLAAEASCLSCHKNAADGEILGGISVSIAAAPILETSAARKRTTGLAYSFIGLIGIIGIGGATLQINRKKEQAEAANRMKSAFLANMSHDMRTPLTGILGMAELLEHDTPDPRRRCLLSNLRGATESLLGVVDGIMRYSLLEAEGRASDCAPFSLRSELAVCLNALRPACESKGVALVLDIAADATEMPDRLLGEGFRLRQALGNLLGNAVKFTANGSVTLRVDCLEQNREACLLRFRVIDTGTGIPQEERSRIFESFVQGEAGETAPQTGVGLGLSIARHIARRLGGDITLSSVVGQGSVFTLTARFRLDPAGAESPGPSADTTRGAPASDPAAPECAPRSTGMETENALPVSASGQVYPDLAGRCVVVAEDTPVTALFFDEILSRAGARVHTASDVDGARELIECVRPDLALLDMRMPGGTGLSIAAAIRNGDLRDIPPDLPILLLSATNTREQENEARRLHVNGQLMKPVQAEALLRAVDAALAGRPAGKGEGKPAPLAPTSEADLARCMLAHREKSPAGRPMPERFDAAGTLEDLDGNRELLRRLCDLFLEEAETTRAELLVLAAPLRKGDDPADRRQAWRHQAHRLKNGAATLHLPLLREACASLEQLTLDGGFPSDGQALREEEIKLRDALNRVLTAFDDACAALREAGYGGEYGANPRR